MLFGSDEQMQFDKPGDLSFKRRTCDVVLSKISMWRCLSCWVLFPFLMDEIPEKTESKKWG